MSLVLVLTMASLALADAGYQYNAPGATLGLPGKQPANFNSGHSSQHHTALPNVHDKPLSHSISYKDYVYLNPDNGHNIGNHGSVNHGTSNSGIVTAPSIQPTADPIANNGYENAGYAQSFAPAPTVNLNNNYAQNYAPVNNQFNSGHIQKLLPITSFNANSGYSQTSSLSGSNANIGYAQNPISSAGGSLNMGYSQTLSASAVNNLNNGYTHTSVPPANNYFGNVQTSTSADSYLSIGYSNGWVSVNSGLSHGHTNAAKPTAGSHLNAGYSQFLTSAGNASLNNTYSTSSASSVRNTGYAQPLAPSGATSYSNSYAQTSIPSTSGNIINDYSETMATSGSGHYNLKNGGNLDNGYSHTLVPYSSSSSTSNGYAQTSVTSNNINSGYYQTFPPYGSASSSNVGYSGTIIPSAVSGTNNYNTGYSHNLSSGTASTSNGFAQTAISSVGSTSTTPFKVNLNPTSNFDAYINSGNIQTTGSSNLNIGFTQTGSNNYFNGNANTVSVFSGAPITPAVFKHIYFHVPPPDIEEQNVILSLPVKKNYKILFITLPSQEYNLARLKQIGQMSNPAASVEHKTLIYVLVKNPETQHPVVISNRTPSEHQVFFVKYDGNTLDKAAQVNAELDKSGTVQSIVPLEPGLVNGKK